MTKPHAVKGNSLLRSQSSTEQWWNHRGLVSELVASSWSYSAMVSNCISLQMALCSPIGSWLIAFMREPCTCWNLIERCITPQIYSNLSNWLCNFRYYIRNPSSFTRQTIVIILSKHLTAALQDPESLQTEKLFLLAVFMKSWRTALYLGIYPKTQCRQACFQHFKELKQVQEVEWHCIVLVKYAISLWYAGCLEFLHNLQLSGTTCKIGNCFMYIVPF